MAHYLERELRHTINRVEAGHLAAIHAVHFAVEHGYGALGTARHAEGYTPIIPLTSRNWDDELVGWHPSHHTARGGVRPVVPVSVIPKVAVLEGIAGSRHMPMQRHSLGVPIIRKDDVIYDLGTHGATMRPDTSSDPFLHMHQDLHAAITRRVADNPDEIIGVVDLVHLPQETIELTPERGRFGIDHPTETVASLPVRFGDITTLGHIGMYYYEPLAA